MGSFGVIHKIKIKANDFKYKFICFISQFLKSTT